MTRIDLDLSHSYRPDPQSDEDYALLPLKFTFDDGGAYALLGPSGCGKTTLLNCISGLQRPSQGTVSFDGLNSFFMAKGVREAGLKVALIGSGGDELGCEGRRRRLEVRGAEGRHHRVLAAGGRRPRLRGGGPRQRLRACVAPVKSLIGG